MLVAPFLPESLEFLVRQGTNKSGIMSSYRRSHQKVGEDRDTEFYVNDTKRAGVPVKHLFTEGRVFTTVGIGFFFFSFYLLWVLIGWVETPAKRSGASVQQYSVAFAMLHVGSLVTAVIIGRLMDHFNVHKVLIATFLLAFISVCVFGYVASGTFLVIAVMAVITGLFVNWWKHWVVALVLTSYPSPLFEARGIGWAYGVGKVGSMLRTDSGRLPACPQLERHKDMCGEQPVRLYLSWRSSGS